LSQSLDKWLGLETNAEGDYVLTARSLYKSIGGKWGLLESAVPPLSFTITYSITKSVVPSVTVAIGLTIVVLAIQVARKRPILNAFASLFGIGIAAWLALNGGAGDFFVKDFFVNGGWAAGLLISSLVGYPAFGLLMRAVGELDQNWRTDRKIKRLMTLLSVFWAGIYLLRLGVQLPLYFSNQVELLGFAKVLLGLPLFGLWIVLTWFILKRTLYVRA
jgi:hypothetical protein